MDLNLGLVADRKILAEGIRREFDQASADGLKDKERRSHLGASEIGETCARKLWMKFRWLKEEVPGTNNHTEGAMRRLWARGHEEELKVMRWLRASGHKFKDPPEGHDQHVIPRFALGHGGGSCDALGWLPPHWGLDELILYEFKTLKSAYHNKLIKVGVAKCEHTKSHYDQMNLYGPELGVRFCLYCSVNKDTDYVYFELVVLNPSHRDELKFKAHDIVKSQSPPPKAFMTRTNRYCQNMCNFTEICHSGEAVEKNCRSCIDARPVDDGKWHCGKHNVLIPEDAINIAQPCHTSIMTCTECGGSGGGGSCQKCNGTGNMVR